MKKIISLAALCFASTCFATKINLYDQPNANVKPIGTIETNSGIIPIFTPKDSAWTKVADPTNGNVGWVKQADLKAGGFTFTQEVISTGNKPTTQSFTLYGSPSPLTAAQTQEIMNRIVQSQKDVQNMMHEIFKNGASPNLPNFPIIMPVIVMPEQKAAPQK